MSKFLFIDTNIFLSFYEFTNDDLEELKKLSAMLLKGEIALLLPSQVSDEFWRHRDERIAVAIRHVDRQAKRRTYPRPFQGLTEFEKLQKLEDEAAALHKSLVVKAESGAKGRGFAADVLIAELFERANVITVTTAHLDRARRRRDLSQPPGKKSGLGDAVNWEALLVAAPKDEELHFVSADSDWVSAVSPNELNSYLQNEWHSRKNSGVTYYPRLSEFFRKNYPDIKLEADVGVELLIRDLASSGTFASTHAVIEELQPIVDFSPRQVQQIAEAYIENDQVHRIIADPDVKEFLNRVVDEYHERLDAPTREKLVRLLKTAEEIQKQMDSPA